MQSKITLSADKEGDITRLKDSFYNAPYKLVHFGNKFFYEHLELIVMCSSPGVMDEDTLEMNIQINPNAEVKLFTQSFNKLHPMKVGAAQKLHLKIEDNAIFQYLPHPVTPFENAIFETVNQIEMAENATLIFGDIYTSGRVHSGESFKFTKIHSQTEIRRNQKLIFKDNVLMDPRNQPIHKSLFWGDYTHHATLIYVSPAANSFKDELDEILDEENIKELDFGFTQFSDNGIIIRALSHSGEKLYDWFKMVSDMCWQFTQHFNSNIESADSDMALPEVTTTHEEKVLLENVVAKKDGKPKKATKTEKTRTPRKKASEKK